MTRTTKLVSLLAIAFVAVVGAQAAQAGPEEPVDVPSTIAAPAGTKLFLVGHAVGVQIYRCDAVGSGYKWNLLAPRADLYGDNGKLLATHFGGPTWQAKDGSFVVAKVRDRVPVDGTIDWLLLEATSTSAGPDGDRLTGTTFIQRLATSGGLAPAPSECAASTAGTTKDVPYTADYFFWKGDA
jgi:hypothetical protein